MTESTTRTEEHILTSDLWLAGESLRLTTPKKEVVAQRRRSWRTTVKMLDNTCVAGSTP